jgi:hypothetical protein
VSKRTKTGKVHNTDTQRPFRLWDAQAKMNLPWRCFSQIQNAHKEAMDETRRSKAGRSIEVYDSRTMRLICQYTRTPTSVRIMS